MRTADDVAAPRQDAPAARQQERADDLLDAAGELAELVEAWRRDSPGCANRVHLNNAGASLAPRPVVETVVGHLRREAEIGGYEAADEAADRIAAVYDDVAALLAASPRTVAIVENATVAFAQALSVFDFQRGDLIATTRSDYTSNQLMYLSLARRDGVEVRYAADLPEGGVDPDSMRALAAHPRCRLVAVTWVPTNSGLVQRVEEVGEICAAAGVPYLVDACQVLGQMPIDVGRLRCDFLAATARKFLRGPRGIGFLYVSERALARGAYPLAVDMRGADLLAGGRFELARDARRFENWEFAYALVLGLGEAARYAREAGIERGGQRALALATYARERLAEVPGLLLMDRGERLCAIVTVAVNGWSGAAAVGRLREAGINASATDPGGGPPRGPGEDAQSLVRLSPHYYNTRAEIDTAVAALEELVRHPPAGPEGPAA
ncbi:MAG TPA: aminotransferase class V-fold PLP-dependent enzyme [Thermoanaerobaculia bacterium]|nr:aminotransferase class V-fold PLP-dependent enzyme [Thermoanaerobaculia bacterium]